MHKVRKATIGIRPTEKMFRVASLSGLVADEIIAASSSKSLAEGYFTNVTKANGGSSLRLTNESLGHYLIVDVENIVFSHDHYDTDREFDADAFFTSFKVLWNSLNSVLKVKRVRRIGYVAEYRFPKKEAASAYLVERITKLKPHGYPDKFSLSYESRRGTSIGGLPDPIKDDFFNHIRQIYDSSADVDHPKSGHYNANLDVQRYYAPPLTKEVSGEVELIRREFERTLPSFFDELVSLGICINGAE